MLGLLLTGVREGSLPLLAPHLIARVDDLGLSSRVVMTDGLVFEVREPAWLIRVRAVWLAWRWGFAPALT